MSDDRMLQDLRWAMFAVNLFLILYYNVVRMVTTWRVVASFGAYEFLASAGQVPDAPWRMPLCSLFLYLALLFAIWGKNRRNIERIAWRVAVCGLEILLCAGLIAAMGYVYSGVALAVLADLVYYVQRGRFRLCFVVILTLLFVFGQYEILSFGIHQISFDVYLSYYRVAVRGWFAGVESLLLSLNILLFVLFMILLFTRQKEENARIRRLNEQLNEANLKLQNYASEMERMTALQERNRLAREIHDTLGHTLTGITMSAEACLVMLDIAPEEVRKRLEIIHRTAKDGLTDVRRSIKALRPDALEQHSLEQALASMIEHFSLSTSAHVHYEQQAGVMQFAPDEEDAVYRIVQESLTNAVRHGKATEIWVRMSRIDNRLSIDIRDNGTGSGKTEEGFGLRHMRERLERLGSSLSYGNRARQEAGEKGFYVTAVIPLREKEGKVRD